MGTTPPALQLIGVVRVVLLVDGERDAPAADPGGYRHEGVRGLRVRRMVVVLADGARRTDVRDVDHAHARVPAARPQLVAEAQCVVPAIAPAAPRRLLAARDLLPRHPPARDFLGPRRGA